MSKKISECHSCNFQTQVKEFTLTGTHGQQKTMLCDICASTFIGNDCAYPSEDGKILRTIGYVTNLIIAEIRRAR